MRHRVGFTVVELVIVISIIGILASVAILSFTTIQRNQRNTAREVQATAIATSLESYYEKHGEYPSPRSIASPYAAGKDAAQILGISSDLFIFPRAQPSIKNVLTINTAPTETTASYVARSVGSSNQACQGKSDGGCDEFTLRYKKEGVSEVQEIKSKHTGRLGPDGNAINTPTATLRQEGERLSVSSTAADCEQSSFNRYSFRIKPTTEADWPSWSAWQASQQFIRDNNIDGATYGAQTKVQCETEEGPKDESGASPEVRLQYLTPAPTPTQPKVDILPVTSAGTLTGRVSASCSGATTLQYRVRTRVDGSSWSEGEWRTDPQLVQISDNPTPGSQYQALAIARCMKVTANTTTTGQEVESNDLASYIHPITRPAAVLPVATSDATITTWNWNPVICPASTIGEYRIQSLADWGYDSDWSDPFRGALQTGWYSDYQGYAYTKRLQARCVTEYIASDWSDAAEATYIRPIDTPGRATGFQHRLSADRRVSLITWNPPACGKGTNTYSIIRAYAANGIILSEIGGPGWGAWSPLRRYTPQLTIAHQQPAARKGIVRGAVRYTCVNWSTDRQSAMGPEATSPVYTL